mgnify:CR=1 FL=1
MTENRLVWLPDDCASVSVEEGIGPVRPLHPDTFLHDVARALDGEIRPIGMASFREDMKEEVWRALVAMCLLQDLVLPSASFRSFRVSASGGRLCRSVLGVFARQDVQILVYEREKTGANDAQSQEKESVALGILDPDDLVLPARNLAPMPEMMLLPWYDGEHFSDPVPHLTPIMREVLIRRLSVTSGHERVQAFLRDLKALETQVLEASSGEGEAKWAGCVKCVFGLTGEEGFEELKAMTRASQATAGCEVLRALAIPDPVTVLPGSTVWTWKGEEIARSSHLTIVEATRSEKAMQALSELLLDEEILETCVRSYNEKLRERLTACLREAAWSDEVHSRVRELAEQIDRKAQNQAGNISLTYPWRSNSPALRSLLEETLGENLAQAALEPFSDRLLLMSGASMDDSVTERFCTPSWDGGFCLMLPPLSRKLARWESEHPDSEYGFVLDSLQLSMDKAGRVTVRFFLRGEKGSVNVSRTYTSMEQIFMQPGQVPLIAMWPSLPLPPDRWSAYYLSVRGRIGAEVYSPETSAWQEAISDDTEEGGLGPCAVLHVSRFPSVVLLTRNALTLGALLYAPAVFTPPAGGEAIGAMDLGESGTAVAWATENDMQALDVPVLWHALLRGNRWDPAGEALPMMAFAGVTESSVLFGEPSYDARSDGLPADVKPFVDGRICPPGDEDILQPTCHFLWRSDPQGLRAQRLMTRELMLVTCFDLVMHGARSVIWYASVPQAMDAEDRRHMQKEMETAARDVEDICSMTCKGIYASWHDVRAAGQYLYSSLNHASFLMLDLGGGDGSLAVWLRGMGKPVLETDGGDGLAMQLHTAFLDIPLTAAQDLSIFPWMDTSALLSELAAARESVEAWERSRRRIDDLLGSHLAQTLEVLCRAVEGSCANYTF